MKAEDISEAMNNINEDFIESANDSIFILSIF